MRVRIRQKPTFLFDTDRRCFVWHRFVCDSVRQLQSVICGPAPLVHGTTVKHFDNRSGIEIGKSLDADFVSLCRAGGSIEEMKKPVDNMHTRMMYSYFVSHGYDIVHAQHVCGYSSDVRPVGNRRPDRLISTSIDVIAKHRESGRYLVVECKCGHNGILDECNKDYPEFRVSHDDSGNRLKNTIRNRYLFQLAVGAVLFSSWLGSDADVGVDAVLLVAPHSPDGKVPELDVEFITPTHPTMQLARYAVFGRRT